MSRATYSGWHCFRSWRKNFCLRHKPYSILGHCQQSDPFDMKETHFLEIMHRLVLLKILETNEHRSAAKLCLLWIQLKIYNKNTYGNALKHCWSVLSPANMDIRLIRAVCQLVPSRVVINPSNLITSSLVIIMSRHQLSEITINTQNRLEKSGRNLIDENK